MVPRLNPPSIGSTVDALKRNTPDFCVCRLFEKGGQGLEDYNYCRLVHKGGKELGNYNFIKKMFREGGGGVIVFVIRVE